MTMHTEEHGNYRTIYDDMNPRIFYEEVRCSNCGEWVSAENVYYEYDQKDPYCEDCLPEDAEDALDAEFAETNPL